MGIAKLYNTTASTQRLSNVSGSKKETWGTNIISFDCAIHPVSGEQSELYGGAFYKHFKLFCATGTDLLTGDRVIVGSTTYKVTGVQEYNFAGSNKHLRATLVLGE